MLQDLRHAVRTLRFNSSFTILAVVVLALGIGFSVAIFSVVNAVFFRPRAVAAPEQLVHVFQLLRDLPRPVPVFINGYRYLRDHDDRFSGLTGHWGTSEVLRADGEAASAAGEMVLANYFDVLGVAPTIGRGFLPEEDDPANPAAAIVISHDLWTRRFKGDPQILGKQIILGGWSGPEKVYTVVGVMGPEFVGINNPWRPSRFWITLAQRNPERADRLSFAVIGRLKPEVSVQQARAFVTPLGAQLAIERGQNPTEAAHYRLALYSAADVRMPFDPTAIAVPKRLAVAAMLVSIMVLIVAASNVTGILMARSVSRSGEVAIRRALGASGGRIVRLFLAETLLVAFIGASAGLLLAQWLLNLFHAATPATYAIAVPIDIRVLLFTAITCLVAGLLIGIVPGSQSARLNLVAILVGSSGIIPESNRRLRHAFVIPQIALSLVILAVGSVQVRGLAGIENQDRGYDLERLLTVSPTLRALPDSPAADTRVSRREADEKHADRSRRFYTQLLQRLQSSPELAAAGLANRLPVIPGNASHAAVTAEALDAGFKDGSGVVQSVISPGFHAAMRTRLVAGRDFDGRDTRSSPKVAIIDSVLAQRLWPGGDALGRSLAVVNLFPAAGEQPERLIVVGVVEPTLPILADTPEAPTVYLAMGQQWRPAISVIAARGAGNPAELTNVIKNRVAASDTLADVHRAKTGRELAADVLYPRRMAIATLALAALSALLLSSIGLYGLISYSVAQRVYELGVRAALGAGRRDIIALVLREGMAVLAIATLLGLALSVPAMRASAKLAAGLPGSDPAALAVTLAILVSVVLIASCIPARRAAALDPLDALRRL